MDWRASLLAWHQAANISMYRLSFATLATLLILSQPGDAQETGDLYLGAAAHGPIGPAQDGFALSLQPTRLVVHIGDPIPVLLELRNVSGLTQNAYFMARNSNYSFTIVDEHGHLVPRNVDSGFGLDPFSGPPSGHPVAFGFSIFGRFRLDELYQFTAPGRYTAKVSRGIPTINGQHPRLESNSIVVTVLGK